MLTLIIRAIIIYLLVLLVFRLMGKRQLGQMQPFELVLTLVIADLATIPMAEAAIPTLDGIVPLITLVVVHFFLTFFSKKSKKITKIINGKPAIIINPNGIDFKSLEQLNLTVEDVFEAIRGQGYFKLEEVQYAIMETNGVVNVLPKSAFSPVTTADLSLKTEETCLPYTIISEGALLKENLPLAKIDETKVFKILSKKRIDDIKKVVVFTIDENGACYLQVHGEPYKTFNIKVGGQDE